MCAMCVCVCAGLLKYTFLKKASAKRLTPRGVMYDEGKELGTCCRVQCCLLRRTWKSEECKFCENFEEGSVLSSVCTRKMHLSE